MAGHLLATVNREAAEAIGQEGRNATSSLPPVGTAVRYFPRPGEGRGGRRQNFFMLVTEHHDDGRVGGVAIFDANDFRDVMPCWQKTEAVPFPAWDWMVAESTSGEVITRDELDRVTRVFKETGARVADAMAELSRWGNPAARIDALEQRIAELQSRVSIIEMPLHGPSVSDLTARMEEAERRLGDKNSPRQPGLADFVGDLQARVAALECELGIGDAPKPAQRPSVVKKGKSKSQSRAVMPKD